MSNQFFTLNNTLGFAITTKNIVMQLDTKKIYCYIASGNYQDSAWLTYDEFKDHNNKYSVKFKMFNPRTLQEAKDSALSFNAFNDINETSSVHAF